MRLRWHMDAGPELAPKQTLDKLLSALHYPFVSGIVGSMQSRAATGD